MTTPTSKILEELAEVTVGKTVISVTHRLALAMRADRIFVLDQGKIVETGSHDELVKQGGLYRKLFEDQNNMLIQSGLVPNGSTNGEREGHADGAPDSRETEALAPS